MHHSFDVVCANGITPTLYVAPCGGIRVGMHIPIEGYSRSRGTDPNADVGKWLVLLNINTHLPPP